MLTFRRGRATGIRGWRTCFSALGETRRLAQGLRGAVGVRRWRERRRAIGTRRLAGGARRRGKRMKIRNDRPRPGTGRERGQGTRRRGRRGVTGGDLRIGRGGNRRLARRRRGGGKRGGEQWMRRAVDRQVMMRRSRKEPVNALVRLRVGRQPAGQRMVPGRRRRTEQRGEGVRPGVTGPVGSGLSRTAIIDVGRRARKYCW